MRPLMRGTPPANAGQRSWRGWRRTLPLALLIACVCAGTQHASAGHESPYYPSFYPQEIRLESVQATSVPALFQKNSLHAYVGSDPFTGGSLPATLSPVESLGSFVVVSFNPGSPQARTAQGRCATGRKLLASLADLRELFAFHPYPVTPYHPDYLHQFDLAQAWKQPAAELAARGRAAGDPALKVKASGKLGEMLARAGWSVVPEGWDAAIEEAEAGALVARGGVHLNGWLGPPWLKEGWFHAHLLLAGGLQEAARRQRVNATFQRLVNGAYAGTVEKVNLERALVTLLTEGCQRLVAGYTLRRGYFNTDFTEGVENVAVDSQAGLVSPIFVRTVKLKDFPWNGYLRVGFEGKPAAAWNPIAGMNDAPGRLLWAALGDPALFPAPTSGEWIANRVEASLASGVPSATKVDMPPDALVPEPSAGLLRPVGPGKAAKGKILYKIPLSSFHDGTRMTVADLVYPFIFAARASAKGEADGKAYDPAVDQATALARRWLAGFRITKAELFVKNLGDLKLEWVIQTIEVYLNHGALDPSHAAAVAAPPWSTLPWPLLVLMEEAVARGWAAFSAEEAKRRGVAWLDLVRDPALQAKLAALAEEFEREGHLPEALKRLASAEEARERWGALRQFLQRQRHLLVTNGPYRLEKWTGDVAVLQVFRDPSYPVGLGTFDVFAWPPKASITKVDRRGPRLQVSVEVEKAVRAQRSFRMAREPLTKDAMTSGFPIRATCPYLVVGADGQVRSAGAGRYGGDATFTLDLKGLKPGPYTVLTAVIPNGNAVNPDVRAIPFRAD